MADTTAKAKVGRRVWGVAELGHVARSQGDQPDHHRHVGDEHGATVEQLELALLAVFTRRQLAPADPLVDVRLVAPLGVPDRDRRHHGRDVRDLRDRVLHGAAPQEQAGAVSGLGQAGNELGGALGIGLLAATAA